MSQHLNMKTLKSLQHTKTERKQANQLTLALPKVVCVILLTIVWPVVTWNLPDGKEVHSAKGSTLSSWWPITIHPFLKYRAGCNCIYANSASEAHGKHEIWSPWNHCQEPRPQNIHTLEPEYTMTGCHLRETRPWASPIDTVSLGIFIYKMEAIST